MSSQLTTVVRYTALIGGISYGLLHQGTLQKKHDEHRAEHAAHHRQHLIEEARKAWKVKQAEKASGASQLITDIENPKFDLEKLIEHYAKSG